MVFEFARNSLVDRCLCLFLSHAQQKDVEAQHTGKNPSALSGSEEQDRSTITVGWDSDTDPENPQNWPIGKKLWVTIVIWFYSFVVYFAASIYTSGEELFINEYSVSHTETSLGLALYVLGYGVGPLLFSPLSEIPRVGRNLPYLITFFIFCILCVPTALAPTAPGFYVLRLLQGFFGSPCLATGGASLSDVYAPSVLPHAMSAYVIALSSGPALGPVMSGFAVPVLGWRFSMWEVLIAAGVIMAMLAFLPETSHANILYRRAERLQQANPQHRHHTCAAEKQHAHLSSYNVLRESLLIPMRITLLDPAILFVNIYMMLVYGIYYSFFEVFPLVYEGLYGFSTGEQSIVFIAIAVGVLLAALFYNIYIYRVYTPKFEHGGFGKPEDVLKPAMLTAFGTPIGLLLFGWSARASVHWIVPTIGIVIYPASISIVLQCIFLYLPACYPHYAASVFAATDFTRSAFACAAVLFSRPMFLNLGVGGGCSLLAGLTILCIFGIFGLYSYGEILRQRSKFR
ncbi:unnamed protein product [Penicillium olsonii]|uniref:Major facilitator superfamily (MFS) profile domain-containing protein n=1 Tax=Penicillium olsonii TaxID=99116 RepID=A0A9W4HWE8_PENOL|nr:unnamed protein product [Penicillium olsonii]CAG8220234.1 unnamed protein product [Penicillium olsonii]